MGGLGRVARRMSERAEPFWPTWIEVHTSHAGARLPRQPVRRLEPGREQGGNRRQEVLLARLGPGARAGRARSRSSTNSATATAHDARRAGDGSRPPAAAGRHRQGAARLRPRARQPHDRSSRRRTSLAGTTQVVARVLEVALHKAHVLGLRSATSSKAAARAPLPPPAPDGVAGDGPHQRRDPLRRPRAPHRARRRRGGASASPPSCRRATRATTGGSFADIFTASDYDFYKIDAALFAPAEVWVSNLDSGAHLARRRARHAALLRAQWRASHERQPAHRDHDRRDRLAHVAAAEGAPRARRARRAASTSPIAASTRRGRRTASRSPASAATLPDAVFVRGIAGGSFEQVTLAARRPACAARIRRAGLQRRARDRAQRRQVDDELAAASPRRADAADLGRRIGGVRAARR